MATPATCTNIQTVLKRIGKYFSATAEDSDEEKLGRNEEISNATSKVWLGTIDDNYSWTAIGPIKEEDPE